MKELLLIGESGFLGKELKKELIKAKNYNVSGTSKNVSSKHYFNLNEKHNLKLEKYSVVILLAAITNIQYCEDNPDLCFDTNVTSTIRFIDEAVKKGCFVIFLSSNAVFDGQKKFYSFDDAQSPITKYGESKSIVEKWIAKNHPNDVAILRLTRVLSENKKAWFDAPFVERWIEEVSSIGISKVYTNHFISPISTSEAISAIKKLIACELGGLFQKGADFEISYADFAKNAFREAPKIYANLKRTKQGNRNFYNSLKTYLPKSSQ